MAEVKTGARKIDIRNKANIRNINEHHSALLPLLQSSDAVEIDVTGCQDVDLSFVQLIESARLYAKTAGKAISLSAPADGSVLETLRRAGFLDRISPEDARFWLHREV